MESTMQQELDGAALTAEIDRLGEKIDNAARLIAGLRKVRSDLEESCRTQERDWARLQQAAGGGDCTALLERLELVAALEKENAALRQERETVARRLGALIEKVDLLEGDS